MRADNTRHIIAAAQRRHELTRAKAIQALRTLDAEGRPVTFEAVAQAAAVSRSWLYAQPDVRAEIERLALPQAAEHPPPRSPHVSGPPTPPCCAGSKPPTNAIRSWPRTTAGYATSSPDALGERRTASPPRPLHRPSTSQLGNDRPLLKGHPMHPSPVSTTTSTRKRRRSQTPRNRSAQDNATPGRTRLGLDHRHLHQPSGIASDEPEVAGRLISMARKWRSWRAAGRV